MTHEEFQSKFHLVLPDNYLRHAAQGEDAEEWNLVVHKRYRQFFEEYEFNGVATIRITTLLYLNAPLNYSSMPRVLEMLRYYRDLPEQMVPIASTGSGDAVLCDANAVTSQQGDAVYFWDHESGDIMPVCRTLDEFYAGLQKAEDPDEIPPKVPIPEVR